MEKNFITKVFFKNFMDKHKINYYSMCSIMKSLLVEDWNSILKENIWKSYFYKLELLKVKNSDISW